MEAPPLGLNIENSADPPQARGYCSERTVAETSCKGCAKPSLLTREGKRTPLLCTTCRCRHSPFIAGTTPHKPVHSDAATGSPPQVQAHETGHKRGTCEPGKNTTNRNSEASGPGAATKVCSKARRAQDPCSPAGRMETRAPEARPECSKRKQCWKSL